MVRFLWNRTTFWMNIASVWSVCLSVDKTQLMLSIPFNAIFFVVTKNWVEKYELQKRERKRKRREITLVAQSEIVLNVLFLGFFSHRNSVQYKI